MLNSPEMTVSATFPTAALLSPELTAGLGEIALEPPAADTRQAFLRFRLGQDWALLPLVQATEIVQLSPTEILPVPTMPDWLLGVQNWRGEMLWAIDLSRMVGFEPICGEVVGQTDVKAIVVNVAGQQLGMVVKDVQFDIPYVLNHHP